MSRTSRWLWSKTERHGNPRKGWPVMKNFLRSTVALAALIAAPAMAADLGRPAPAYKAPPPVYVFSWTGCYIGANGGGMWVNKEYGLGAGGVAPVGTLRS